MRDVKLTLNIRNPTSDKSDALTAASKKKADSIETIDEAWARIFAMKNSEADVRRLYEVKRGMSAGQVGRDSPDKRFSKAEALRMWRVLDEQRQAQRLRDMVENMPDNYELITTKDAFERFLTTLKDEQEIVFDVETTGTDVYSDYLVGHVISAVKADIHAYIPTKHDEGEQLPHDYVLDGLRPFYEDESIGKIAHNAGYDIHVLRNEGVKLRGLTWDTLEAMKLLNENEPSYALKPLVSKYLNDPSSTYGELFGKRGFNEIPLDEATAYAAKDGDVTLRLRDFQRHHLSKMPSVLEYYETVEVPLIPIIVDMEREGYEIDLEFAKEYGEELRREADEAGRKVFDILGEINLNSPVQLKSAIEAHVGREIENTDAKKTLKPLSRDYPIIADLLKYRELNKLLSTYVDALPTLIKERTGRIHTQFNQNGAKTGRFSSGGGGSFNIQNQPKEARSMFVAPEGSILLGGDWSQQEYRCLAYFSQEPALIQNYIDGNDLYAEVASDVFKKPVSECQGDSKYRSHAKVLMLAVAYGGGANMLATSIGVTKQEAQKFLTEFFDKYPKVAAWIKHNQETVKRQGFVWMDGEQRKRRLPDAKNRRSKSYYSSVFTQSTNARVQGSAAIQTKRTMIAIDELCKRKTAEGDGRWSLWTVVHDEAILCVPETVTIEDIKEFEDVMINTYQFGNVPNKCDVELQRRWGDSVALEDYLKGAEIPQL